MRFKRNDPEAPVEVLVVEDSPTQAKQLQYLLEQNGFRASVAHDGVAALAALEQKQPALVLSDVVMPEMDGYELCRRMKASAKLADVPVILVTSLSNPNDVVQGLECGADNFIVKPYHEDELLARIQYILLNRRLQGRESAEIGVEVYFGGQRHFITSGRLQILNLLLTTYDTAVRKNHELEQVREELQDLNNSLEEKVRERTADLLAEIAQRVRAEKELRESEERYRTLFEHSPIGIYRTTPDGRILAANPALVRVLGYESFEELASRNLEDSGFELGHSRAAFKEAVAPQGEIKGHEGVWTTKSGGTLFMRENARAIRGSDGAICFYEGTVEDVTERKRLEEQLRQAQKMEAIGTLAGGVAHDFNNLLQALLSGTQVLRALRPDPERFTASLEELEEHIRRGAALTRQLLLFARREVFKPELVDLNDVVLQGHKLLRRLVQEDIAFTVTVADAPLPVKADSVQLDQILVNLVVNARDAMPNGGPLAIECGRQGEGEVWLAVRDSGVGMSDELRDQIFDPFFTTKGLGKGTGLGLSVVHGIVAGHGGRIEVESEMGKGSTFRIVLPRCGSGAPPPAREEALSPAELPQGRGERVLVVEDEEGARAGLKEILTMLGYAVTAVGSGEEAGVLPVSPAFDVLLTDLLLPGVHGPELARGLLDRSPQLKVILMSGYAEDEVLRRSLAAGETRFLQKPFDMAMLAREIRAALDEGNDG